MVQPSHYAILCKRDAFWQSAEWGGVGSVGRDGERVTRGWKNILQKQREKKNHTTHVRHIKCFSEWQKSVPSAPNAFVIVCPSRRRVYVYVYICVCVWKLIHFPDAIPILPFNTTFFLFVLRHPCQLFPSPISYWFARILLPINIQLVDYILLHRCPLLDGSVSLSSGTFWFSLSGGGKPAHSHWTEAGGTAFAACWKQRQAHQGRIRTRTFILPGDGLPFS